MVLEQTAQMEAAMAASAASTRLRLQSRHGQASRGNNDHQSTLHGSILQNSVKRGKLSPSMTATLVIRKSCTNYMSWTAACLKQPVQSQPPSKNKPRRASGEAWELRFLAQFNELRTSSRKTARSSNRSCSGNRSHGGGTSRRTSGDGRSHRSSRNRKTNCWHNRTTAQLARHNRTTAQPERHTTAQPPSHNRKMARWRHNHTTALKNNRSCSHSSHGAGTDQGRRWRGSRAQPKHTPRPPTSQRPVLRNSDSSQSST
jgi:hypothetical protein